MYPPVSEFPQELCWFEYDVPRVLGPLNTESPLDGCQGRLRRCALAEGRVSLGEGSESLKSVALSPLSVWCLWLKV